MEAALRTGDPWQWRLRRLLLLSVQYVCAASSKDAIAAPLRVVEVFTSLESAQQVLGPQLGIQHLSNTYAYLVRKGINLCPGTLIFTTCSCLSYFFEWLNMFYMILWNSFLGYMQYVRELLDSKTPPLLESSTNPPTPLVACLFDMLVRPLQLVSLTPDHHIR